MAHTVKGTFEIPFLTSKDSTQAVRMIENLFAGMGVRPGQFKVDEIKEVPSN